MHTEIMRENVRVFVEVLVTDYGIGFARTGGTLMSLIANVPKIKLNDGCRIPQLGLGVWQVPDEQVQSSVETALAAGYRLVDTAAIYRNEAGVGAGLKASGVPRSDIFLTTKLWNDKHDYDAALRAFDESAKQLGVDYLDLYLIHWPVADSTAYLEAWRALVQLKQDGRAKSIGVSNFTQENLQRVMDESGVVPAVNQIELHPEFPQKALRAFHAKHGIATESWSPLGQGGDLNDPRIRALAEKHGKTPAQIVLRWHLENGLIAIPKSVTSSRIRENIDVFNFSLSAEDLAVLDGVENGNRRGPDPATFTFKNT
jgi:2,5-diketo-D-gluconate reductase A